MSVSALYQQQQQLIHHFMLFRSIQYIDVTFEIDITEVQK